MIKNCQTTDRAAPWWAALMVVSALILPMASTAIADSPILEVDTRHVPANLPPDETDPAPTRTPTPPGEAIPPGVRIPISKLPNNAYGVAPATQTSTTVAPATQTSTTVTPATQALTPVVPATPAAVEPTAPQRATPRPGR